MTPLRAAMAVENSRREVCTVVEHPSVTAGANRRFDGCKTPYTEGTRSGICTLQQKDLLPSVVHREKIADHLPDTLDQAGITVHRVIEKRIKIRTEAANYIVRVKTVRKKIPRCGANELHAARVDADVPERYQRFRLRNIGKSQRVVVKQPFGGAAEDTSAGNLRKKSGTCIRDHARDL